MGTKTISIDLEAYEKLRAARQNAKDTFSQVIKRAQWQEPAKTGAALLEALPHMPLADEAVIEYLTAAHHDDMPPPRAGRSGFPR